MDLTFTEAQQAIAELTDTILGDLCPPERLRADEVAADSTWPRDVWVQLAAADLLGLSLPESVGGGGYGLIEAALVIERAAFHAVPLPLYATLVLGAGPIAEFGSVEQQRRWLPGVVSGERILTGCLVGARDQAAVDGAPVIARRDREGWVLTGEAWYVPYAEDADALVVPVQFGDGPETGLVVVDLPSEGTGTEALIPMSGESQSIVTFTGVRLDDERVLAGSKGTDGSTFRWLNDRAVTTTCVAQTGNCAGALALTARYVSEREQFGVKLATLQAVSQRAADAYIDTELVRLTAWHATWRISSGLDATDELAVAKMFTGEAGQRVVAAAQHLHGGVGVDLDYPIHRYFRWAKLYELRLGSAAKFAASLGSALAGTSAGPLVPLDT